MGIVEQFAAAFGHRTERLIDSRGVAALLGVTRQRVGQLVGRDPSFPDPVTTLSGGRIWWRAAIEAWIAVRRPANVAGAGPYRAEAAELIRLAEVEAACLGHRGLGTWHMWLAFVRPDSPGPIRDVLASLGVDEAEMRRAVEFTLPRRDEPVRRRSMSPHLGRILEDARTDGGVTGTGVALALLDNWDRDPRTAGPVEGYLDRRGFDRSLLRARILRARSDPTAVRSMGFRAPPRRRPAPRRKPRRLDLASNPLGHDPWSRRPWGTVFATTRDGRAYRPGGIQWFFTTDADGYVVRTVDGRPVGCRWRVLPKPGDSKPLRGLLEVLPMPGPEVADWTTAKFGDEE